MRPNSRPAGRLAVKRLRCTSAATSFYSVYVERLLKTEAEAFVRDPAALARSCHVVALAGAPAHALQERHADCSGRLVREDRLVLPSTLGGCCRRARQRTEHTSMLRTAAYSSVYPAKSCPAADGAASAGRCAPGTHTAHMENCTTSTTRHNDFTQLGLDTVYRSLPGAGVVKSVGLTDLDLLQPDRRPDRLVGAAGQGAGLSRPR